MTIYTNKINNIKKKKDIYDKRAEGFLLKEDTGFLLLESGFKIIISREAVYKKKN